jgi:hypothetical protein
LTIISAMANGIDAATAIANGRHFHRIANPIASASSRLLGRTHTATANATPQSAA